MGTEWGGEKKGGRHYENIMSRRKRKRREGEIERYTDKGRVEESPEREGEEGEMNMEERKSSKGGLNEGVIMLLLEW